MEVLYEDPKEDAVSVLSTDDVFDRKSDLEQRKNTLQSWKMLEEEIRDLHDLIAEFSNIAVAGVSNTSVHIQASAYVCTGVCVCSARYLPWCSRHKASFVLSTRTGCVKSRERGLLQKRRSTTLSVLK